TCVTEHKAILDACKHLEEQGVEITYLPVDQYGLVDLEALKKAIRKETILVSIMAANNEIGTLAPLEEIGKITREHGLLFHSDAAQALGHIPLDVQKMNIDLLSMSAHKVYGPKGVGALYRRRSNPRVRLSPVIYGGGHEKGLRSGTLNVPGIVGFGKAVEIGVASMQAEGAQYREWTTYMFEELKKHLEEVHLNGHPTLRLPNNLNVSIPGIESRALIVQLENIAISTGSACTSAVVEPSHVIMELGFGEKRAHSSIRIGIGRFNSKTKIEQAAKKIIYRISSLRFQFSKKN
ncbi:MAG: cysteine desulfurase family protein, partial [Bacteroidota bacterium]